MAWRYYKCSHCPEFHFKPKGDDTSSFISHLRDTHNIDNVKLSDYEVKDIHPRTGSDDIKTRGKFWNNIVKDALDIDNLDYDYEVDESDVNMENMKKLMNTCDFDYLYEHYFEGKITSRKKIENLVGVITIELLIMLVNIYREDMDVDEVLNKEEEEEKEEEKEEEEEEENKYYEFPDSVVNEDCISGMKKIPDDTIDIVICDPPYNIGKDFGNNSDKQEMDGYLEWCDKWIYECIRILKPDGTLFIYGFSEILAFIRVRITINVRWIIWHYTNKVVPSLHFWQRTHESILCCSKEKPHFNRDEVREPYTDGFIKNAAGKVRKPTKGRFSNGTKETIYTAHKDGALPRDVIKVSALAGGAGKKEGVDHPTQKPLELCEKLIKSSMKKPDETFMVVPFAGSGSECVAAQKLGVNFVGYEINPTYVELCKSRLE